MKYLAETYFLDFSDETIQGFLSQILSPKDTPKEKAVKIYNAIRDRWYYNPYKIFFKKEEWKASMIFQRPHGHCIDKAILMVACLRAVDIPARLHLGKVKNHIGVEKIIEKIGSDELSPHGYLDVFLNGKWIKASPAFNTSLCEKLNVDTLDFDGENDSLFQEFDRSGGVFMEYLEDFGHFEDVPLQFIFEEMKRNYSDFWMNKKGVSLEQTIISNT